MSDDENILMRPSDPRWTDLPFIGTRRGRQLALCGWPQRATITVELSGKWYGIWLLTPLDVASRMYQYEELNFGVLEPHRADGAYFCDHVPNPHAVRRFCKANDYELDEFAEEMIIGRWEQEAKSKGEYTSWP